MEKSPYLTIISLTSHPPRTSIPSGASSPDVSVSANDSFLMDLEWRRLNKAGPMPAILLSCRIRTWFLCESAKRETTFLRKGTASGGSGLSSG